MRITEKETKIMQDESQFHVDAEAHSASDNEIDLTQLFRILWNGKAVIVSVALVAGLLAFGIMLIKPNIYLSQAVVAPVSDSDSGGLAAIAGQLGGLASLAGVRLGKGGASKVSIALEVLKSRKFISEFIKKHHILVQLLAPKKWDPETGKLMIDPDKYDANRKRWSNESTKGGEPSEWKAYKAFSKILKVNQDKDNGLITIGVEYISPELAQQWASWLVEDINNEIRRRDIDEAQRSIDYLNMQRQKTSVAGMQQVFFKLIEQQTQTIMLANVRDEYVFKIIDPPALPEEKVGPKRVLVVALATILGLLLACIVIFFRDASRR